MTAHPMIRILRSLLAGLAAAGVAAGLAGCDLNLQAVIVSPSAEKIDISVGETVAFEGAAVGGVPFSATLSDDTDSATDLDYRYSWDTDGNPLAADTDGTIRADQDIDVTFPEAGTFTVSLTVTDRKDDTSTARVTVVVAEAATDALTATIVSPTLASIDVAKDQAVTFHGAGSGGVPFDDLDADDTVADAYGYFWDVLDLEDVDVDVSDASSVYDTVVTLTFTQTGVYTVTFTVKDSRGAIDTASVTVTVR